MDFQILTMITPVSHLYAIQVGQKVLQNLQHTHTTVILPDWPYGEILECSICQWDYYQVDERAAILMLNYTSHWATMTIFLSFQEIFSAIRRPNAITISEGFIPISCSLTLQEAFHVIYTSKILYFELFNIYSNLGQHAVGRIQN